MASGLNDMGVGKSNDTLAEGSRPGGTLEGRGNEDGIRGNDDIAVTARGRAQGGQAAPDPRASPREKVGVTREVLITDCVKGREEDGRLVLGEQVAGVSHGLRKVQLYLTEVL